jgi:glycosyltransferase involved in cell wall biosynthesis
MLKISVVIPLYNKEKTVTNTLDSVLNQTHTNFEIIIVNDGSTDNSVEKIRNFKDDRILLLNQKNGGAAAARNLGIEKATGSLIAFLDADDYWFPNHLDEIVTLYHDFPNCGLYCSRYSMKISSTKILDINYEPEIENEFRGIVKDYFKASLHYRIGLTSAVSIPKNILEKNPFNTAVTSGQDTELFTKIAIQHPIALTNKTTMRYDFSSGNHLSKTPITKKKLFDIEQFNKEEEKNKSLNQFLDLYRVEYALNFRILGAIEQSNQYLKKVKNPIPLKTQALLLLPPFILSVLIKIKHWLRSKGVDFTVYH